MLLGVVVLLASLLPPLSLSPYWAQTSGLLIANMRDRPPGNQTRCRTNTDMQNMEFHWLYWWHISLQCRTMFGY